MRYELYGLGRTGGFAEFVGAFRSRRAALDSVPGINSGVTPYFMVLETPRKSAVPLGYYAGRVSDGFASLATATYVQQGTTPGKSDILSADYISRLITKLGG